MKKTVSVIIVAFKAEKELFACLSSLAKSQSRYVHETIIIDNNEEEGLAKRIQKAFPHVMVFKSPSNKGFGAANNRGGKHASGEFLFFLNPDTQVQSNAIDTLVAFLQKHKDIGIVAPLLLDAHEKPYTRQGTLTLTPFRAAVALSFLDKYFHTNPISYAYWLSSWDKKTVKEVNFAPAAAFMVSKKNFEKVGGFDENFFLYFEDTDFCKRANDLGLKIVVTPQAKVVHLGGRSTGNTQATNRIFAQSRFRYFRKHFGFIAACIVQLMTKRW